jgi:hypothetical protein
MKNVLVFTVAVALLIVFAVKSDAEVKMTAGDSHQYISFNYKGAQKWLVGSEHMALEQPPQPPQFVIFDAEAAAYRMLIDESGNVGIGDSIGSENPVYKLDVVGNRIRLRNSIATGAKSLSMRTDGSLIDLQAENADLFISAVSNNVLLQTASGGNVGIGTATPNGKLDVNGSIYQRGGVLHADYVFEPGYKLESIEEHSDFMFNNKHLKAVPKAKADENGIEIVEVGSQRRGILEELEKAHIYIHQLSSQNKKLEERIARLEALLLEKQ